MQLDKPSPPFSDYDIYQYRCFGYSLEETAAHFAVDVEVVQDAAERYMLARGIHSPRSTAVRKAIDLARMDGMVKAILPKAVEGDTQAINTFLKLQERTAKLTGMEAPTKQDTHITIDVPWLTRDRLAYKNEDGIIQGNVTDITPVLEVKKAWREGQEPDARKDYADEPPKT